MEHYWKRDLLLHIKKIRILEIFNLAFMDNTTWIAGGKRGLMDQLIVAKKFNRYNGTKVNPDKSKLIENLEERYIQYGTKNKIKIYPEKPNLSMRF